MTAYSHLEASAIADAYTFADQRDGRGRRRGRGTLLALVLAACPTLNGVLFDQPEVILAAERAFAEADLTARARAVGGDFFSSVPAGGDVYLLKSVLQHQVRMEFAYDGGGLAKGGTISLFVDGKKTGEGHVEQTEPFAFGEQSSDRARGTSSGRHGETVASPASPTRSPRPWRRANSHAIVASTGGAARSLAGEVAGKHHWREAGMRLSLWFAAPLLFTVAPAVAEAQSRSGCDTPRPPAVGVALGRSSPYFEPSRGVGDSGTPGSVLSRGGVLFAGRADLPIAGPWRARVEGAATSWQLERQVYSADLREVVATDTVGHVDVRQIVASVGRQAGRAPACGYVLAGGGLYSLNYQGTRYWSPGFALTAGIEFPAGPHGAVQVDVQLHLVNAGGRYPIGSSTVVDGRFSAGWVYRF